MKGKKPLCGEFPNYMSYCCQNFVVVVVVVVVVFSKQLTSLMNYSF